MHLDGTVNARRFKRDNNPSLCSANVSCRIKNAMQFHSTKSARYFLLFFFKLTSSNYFFTFNGSALMAMPGTRPSLKKKQNSGRGFFLSTNLCFVLAVKVKISVLPLHLVVVLWTSQVECKKQQDKNQRTVLTASTWNRRCGMNPPRN